MGRSGAEIGFSNDTAEGRATEDFDYAGRKIERQYAQLGSAQNQDINARGLLNSGAAAAAAEKRAGNKAFQFEPIRRGDRILQRDR